MNENEMKCRVIGTADGVLRTKCLNSGLDADYVEQTPPKYTMQDLANACKADPNGTASADQIKSLEDNIMMHSPETPWSRETYNVFREMITTYSNTPFGYSLMSPFNNRHDVWLRVIDLNSLYWTETKSVG